MALRQTSDTSMDPKYPVYVISKGRWKSRQTHRALSEIGVPHSVVIEPQEYEQYAAVIPPAILHVLPFSNLGQGSIPARNWVWDHAVKAGADRHWIIDDNITGFLRLNQNMKVKVDSGTIFFLMEEFADRYENVAIAGPHYEMFLPRKRAAKPVVFNHRVYSCILINHAIPFRWRGRYNEDTDLSLRALKAGWCTVLFNAFLADKTATMRMKGGNTDQLYVGDGRLRMAQSLQGQHPDVVKIVRKWGRWQHQVDYRPFKKNKLRLKAGIEIPEGVNDYGMKLVRVERKKPG